jgi:hypothetical protein
MEGSRQRESTATCNGKGCADRGTERKERTMSMELLGQAFEDSRPIKGLQGIVSVRDPAILEGASPGWSTIVTISGDHAGLLALATLHESGAHEIILDHCEGVDASEFGFHVYVLWDNSADFREGISDVIRITRWSERRVI